MKRVEDMSPQERSDCFENMVIFIESSIESEQDEPKDFKQETELRLRLVYVNLREMLGLPQGIS